MLYSETSHEVVYVPFCRCGTELVSDAERRQELCDGCADSPLGIEITTAGRYLYDLVCDLRHELGAMRFALEKAKAGPVMGGYLTFYQRHIDRLVATLCTIHDTLFRQQLLSTEQD